MVVRVISGSESSGTGERVTKGPSIADADRVSSSNKGDGWTLAGARRMSEHHLACFDEGFPGGSTTEDSGIADWSKAASITLNALYELPRGPQIALSPKGALLPALGLYGP